MYINNRKFLLASFSVIVSVECIRVCGICLRSDGMYGFHVI